MEAASWDVIGRRWIRCGLLNAIAASSLWLTWEIFLPQGSWLGSAFRFITFQLAEVLFIVGQKMVLHPEEPSPLSLWDMLRGIVSLVCRTAFSSAPKENDTTTQAYILGQKICATRDMFIFSLFLVASGFVSLVSLSSSAETLSSSSSFDMGIRGVTLAICYLVLYLKDKKYLLNFPIIQRQVFFSIKLGLPGAVTSALKIALISLPVGEVVDYLLRFYLVGEWGSFSFWQEIVCFVAAFFTVLSWNICCHLIQVIHTRRYVFAPPQGSAEAETNPIGPLMAVLEDEENMLVNYLGYLDALVLATVSEMNVEAWRRAAFFEESGETYKKLVVACLRPIDRLTLRLVKGLEHVQTGQMDNMKFEMLAAKQSFQDTKLCTWCARIVSSLTAYSRTEDRYGVAQLCGCNGAVVSSLLSCLLIVEVYLGKRSSFQALSFVGPNGIKWAVPFRGAFMDADRKQSLLFKKKSAMHKKAHAMADVLRTAIYGIVTVFRDEMVIGSSSNVYSAAEREWLSRNKPLFGTPEVHLQKLTQFLEFQE